MYGAIIGDISGSLFEWMNLKTDKPETVPLMEPYSRFTDDTVLSIAIAEALLCKRDYARHLKEWGLKYPEAGYGATFWQWLNSNSSEPYNSWGNGSAMRVSPVGWTFDTLEETLEEAKRSAEVTHNHPEGIKGAQSVAGAIFMARNGHSKEEIKEFVKERFSYDLDRTCDEIRPSYEFDISSQGSVPEAIIAFLESRDYSHAIRLAISLEGDSDTIACITGGMAEAFYGEIPDELIAFGKSRLSDVMNVVVKIFREHYRIGERGSDSTVIEPTAMERIEIPVTGIERGILSRAQGCLLGQCVGDALGQLVEFQTKSMIASKYPDGVRDMHDGGTFNTIAGQPTDDTEMALMLARSIHKEGRYVPEKAFEAYRYWFDSDPFDCGNTIASAMYGSPSPLSQANGALMRISPLGIYGSRFSREQLAEWAMEDARMTHPHEACQKSAAVYACTIAEAIRYGHSPEKLYENALEMVSKGKKYFEKSIFNAIRDAADGLPEDFSHKAGWVVIALQNAYYQLLHAENTEEAIVETVSVGGDTDTNGAICGALMGAVHGVESIPARWKNTILNCRPSGNNPDVAHPRPECFWPCDVLNLAGALLLV